MSSITKKCQFCGKNSYESETEAKKVAEEQESLNMYQVELKVYKCPYGHGWHLSSAKPGQKPRS